MRSILQSLAWKEWHEHKWKLVSIVVILWGTATLALSYSGPDRVGMATVMVSICLVPLSIFVGLGSAASERSRGTMAFLQALPVPMWRAALMKLIFGLLTLTLSAVLTLLLFYGWARWFARNGSAVAQFDAGPATVSGNIYLDVLLLFVTLAASLYIWSAATGVNRKDEVSAGAVALAAMAGWYLMLVIGGYLLFDGQEPSNFTVWGSVVRLIAVIGLSTAPAGFLPAQGVAWNVQDPSHTHWHLYLFLIVASALTTHLALAGTYIWRFGRTANLEVRSPQTAVRESSRPDWLSAPRQSAVAAIAWKQFRESGPLVVAGLAGVVGITLGIFCSNASWFLRRPGDLVQMAAVIGECIGFAITLIVGIGICFYDVSPQQNTFWRSRPINPNTWYWVKFFTGLIILITTLFIPLVAVVIVFHPNPDNYLPPDSATALLLGQAALFAAAVATTCLVRHAVYGAILSIPLMYFGVVGVWIAMKSARTIGWANHAPTRMIDMSYSELAWGFLLTFLVCTVIGWLAVRYDWGRKSRY